MSARPPGADPEPRAGLVAPELADELPGLRLRWVTAERVALERLLDGGLRPTARIADACRVAVVETGVGVRALDARAVAPPGVPEIHLHEALRQAADALAG